MGFIDRPKAAEIAARWAEDPFVRPGGSRQGQDFFSILASEDAISDQQLELLNEVVDESLRINGGELAKSLESLGGYSAVFEIFGKDSRQLFDFFDTICIADNKENIPEKHVNVLSNIDSRYSFGKRGEPVPKNSAVIGQGGLGCVYIAFDESIGREIAIKELLDEKIPVDDSGFKKTPALRSRFLQEAMVTAQLEHPSIVPVYDLVRRDDGSLYYTMKLVRGKTLDKALDECKSLAERLKLLPHFVDMCQAIAYAHSRGVVHRDIKPQNIMVGEFGETVVLDWGIAKVRGQKDISVHKVERELQLLQDSDTQKTLEGATFGTPSYMSPEQAIGAIGEIDERSDVWGLGAVLFKILTGQPPFSGDNFRDILKDVAHKPLTPVNEIDKSAPPELAAVAEKALINDKSKRYQSAIDLAKDVEAFLTGARIQVYDYSSWELLRRFVTKNKTLCLLASVLFCLLIAGSIVVYWYYLNAENARVKADYHFSLSLLDKAEDAFKQKDYLGARIYSAASLLYNPYNPYSSHRIRDPELLRSSGAASKIADAHSLLFQAEANKWIVQEKCISDHQNKTWAMAVSPKGELAASVGVGGEILLWSSRPPAFVGKLDGKDAGILATAFSPDGSLLATGNNNRLVLWNTSDHGQVGDVESGSIIMSVAFSPDGRIVAAGHGSGKITFWRTEDLKPITSWTVNEMEVLSICFSPDGRFLASGGRDKTVRIWNTADLSLVAQLKGHEDMIRAVRFSPDGSLLASAGNDKTIRLWNLQTHKAVAILTGHHQTVYTISFSPDGKWLASGGWDEKIIIWSMSEFEQVATLNKHIENVAGVGFTPDGSMLLSVGNDGVMKFWKIDQAKHLPALSGHEDYVRAVAFSPDGRFLASSGYDGTIKLWSFEKRTLLHSVKAHNDYVFCLRFSPDGSLLASTSLDRIVALWSVPDLQMVKAIHAHQNYPMGLDFSPDGGMLATSGFDGTIKLWTGPDWVPAMTLTAPPNEIRQVDFSPDGKLLASSGSDGVIRIWDVVHGTLQKELPAKKRSLSGVQFSPDGKILSFCGDEGIIFLWNLHDDRMLRQIEVGAFIMRTVFSPDGKFILASCRDAMARIFDAETGIIVQKIKTNYLTYDVAFSPDGKYFALDNDKKIEIYPFNPYHWKRDPMGLLLQAEQQAGMKLDGARLVLTND